MCCFSAQFVSAAVLHSVYRLLQCTVCMGLYCEEFVWAVVVHTSYGLL